MRSFSEFQIPLAPSTEQRMMQARRYFYGHSFQASFQLKFALSKAVHTFQWSCLFAHAGHDVVPVSARP